MCGGGKHAALIRARWLLLVAALACGLLATLPWVYSASVYWGLSFDWAVPGAAVLQALGVFVMAKASARPLWLLIGSVSAIAWAVAYFAALAGVAAGAGGPAIGLLLLLPAHVLAMITQIAAFIGFAARRA